MSISEPCPSCGGTAFARKSVTLDWGSRGGAFVVSRGGQWITLTLDFCLNCGRFTGYVADPTALVQKYGADVTWDVSAHGGEGPVEV